MTPPPNPLTSGDTFSVATANGPREASSAARVGAGPRSYGLSAAWAAVVPEAMLTATAAIIATRNRSARRGLVGGCTGTLLEVRGLMAVSVGRFRRGAHRRNHRCPAIAR